MKHTYIFLIIITAIFISCESKNNSDNGILVQEEEKADAVKSTATCIWKEVSVKDSPSEKGKFLTSVFLGERFTFLEDTASEKVGDKRILYTKIQLTDGKEGWVRSDFIAVGATGAAFTKEATIYKRPDLMTSTSKTFSMMDFVAIKTTSTSGWVEVIGKRVGDSWFTTGWVKKENLTERDVDVAFSIFYQRAMDNKDFEKQTKELEALLLKDELSNSIFYAAVDNRVNGLDADEVEVNSEVADTTASEDTN